MHQTNKFDWKLTIRTNIFILKTVGLWPKGVQGYKLNFYVLQSAVLLTVFLFGHVFFQAVNLVFIYNNLEAVTEIIYILLTEILLVFKVHYVIKNMKLLKKLMRTLESDAFQPRSSKQMVIIQPSLKLWKVMYEALFSMTCGANIFWAVSPIIDKSSDERRLPFLAWYPYDWKISPLYEFTYFYQIISCCYISAAHLNIDTLIAALNMYTGNQLDILCDNLRNLRVTEGMSVKEDLISCVSHHHMILSFAKNCNQFFNWIIFLQFFVSGISLGLTMFQLSLIEPFSTQFYSLLSYANAVIVQIFMYCWFGNEVRLKSEKIPYTVFQSDWTGLSQKVKKNLLFLVMRTQEPLEISALNLFGLSLETFMKILKTAWSYFALLNQVNSK